MTIWSHIATGRVSTLPRFLRADAVLHLWSCKEQGVRRYRWLLRLADGRQEHGERLLEQSAREEVAERVEALGLTRVRGALCPPPEVPCA